MFVGNAKIRWEIPTLGVLLIWWAAMPIMAVLPMFAVLAFLPLSKVPRRMLLFLIFLSLGLINATKTPLVDLAGYYEQVRTLADLPISRFNEVNYWLDPLFYFVSAVLAHASSGSGAVFITFWTLVIYGVLFAAISKMSRDLDLKFGWQMAVLAFAVFYGYHFELTAHATRQYVAASFLALGFVFCVGSVKPKLAWLFFAMSFLAHFSTLLFLPIFLLPFCRGRWTWRVALALAAAAPAALIAGSLNFLRLAYYMPHTGFRFIDGMIDKCVNLVGQHGMYAGQIGARNILEFFFFLLLTIYSLACLQHRRGVFMVPTWMVAVCGKMRAVPMRIFDRVFQGSVSERELPCEPGKYMDIGMKNIIVFIFLLNILLLSVSVDIILIRYFFYFYAFSVIFLPFILKSSGGLVSSTFLFAVCLSPIWFFRLFGVVHWQYAENSWRIIFCRLPELILASAVSQ